MKLSAKSKATKKSKFHVLCLCKVQTTQLLYSENHITWHIAEPCRTESVTSRELLSQNCSDPVHCRSSNTGSVTSREISQAKISLNPASTNFLFAAKILHISLSDKSDLILFCRVKELESKISELENEVYMLTQKNSDLEEQLKKLKVKVEEHKDVIRGREETAVKKAEQAKQLQEEVKETEENIHDTDQDFVKTAHTDIGATTDQ